MGSQLPLEIGRGPGRTPGETTYAGDRMFFVSTTWMLRELWIEDYKARLIEHDRPAITMEDIERVSVERDAANDAVRAVRDRNNKAGYAHKQLPEPKPEFVPEEEPRWWPSDSRLSVCCSRLRIPVIVCDDETWLAGEKGNSREIIRTEVINTEFFPVERDRMLAWMDSPDSWDKQIVYRMCERNDVGEETERLIREGDLSDESRENLLYNLDNMRRSSLKSGCAGDLS